MNNISKINQEDIIFVKKNFSKYTNIIVHYIGNNSSLFYDNLAEVLTNCIIDNYEKVIIHKLLNFNYFYFEEDELSKIEDNCFTILKNCSDSSNNSMQFPAEILDRKENIFNSCLRYVTENKGMILDGFVRFRLSNYINSLDCLIDFCVNQFIMDREYTEFIDFMKLYIKSKPSQSDLVHLIYLNNQSILLDENKNVIVLSHNNLDTHYLSDISFSSNDYALNTLLSLLPKKIIIHLVSNEDEFIKTLKLIFGTSISVCTNCEICSIYKTLNSNIATHNQK